MIAWLHAHALAAVILAAFGGLYAGIGLMCLLVSGRDPHEVRQDERARGCP